MLSNKLSNNYSFEGVGHQVPGESGEFVLFTRRINSPRLSRRDCGIVFGSLAVFSLIVAVVFAALGAWLILPFAGLEAMALYLAFDWVVRHSDDSESLAIRGDAVMLAVRENASTRHYEFNRVWVKLVVERRAHSTQSVRLALRSHGKEVEVGRYLDDGGRQRLARELKARLARRD
jgi:uncharacterized membrane protein